MLGSSFVLIFLVVFAFHAHGAPANYSDLLKSLGSMDLRVQISPHVDCSDAAVIATPTNETNKGVTSVTPLPIMTFTVSLRTDEDEAGPGRLFVGTQEQDWKNLIKNALSIDDPNVVVQSITKDPGTTPNDKFGFTAILSGRLTDTIIKTKLTGISSMFGPQPFWSTPLKITSVII